MGNNNEYGFDSAEQFFNFLFNGGNLSKNGKPISIDEIFGGKKSNANTETKVGVGKDKTIKPIANNNVLEPSKENGYNGYKMEIMRDNNGNKTSIRLLFCVPGLDMNQLSITETNGIVTVTSTVEVPFFGKLKQSIRINELYDINKMTAKLKNGVLTIEAPVVENKSRKIDIVS